MSGISSIPGNNIAPVSFPGVSSGIDYNAIILKLTAINLLPVQRYNTQITALQAQNTELIKINGLLASVQTALTALSQTNQFSAVSATSSAPGVATATSIPGTAAIPGTYTVTAVQVATPTSLINAAGSGLLPNATVALASVNANLQISATNGTGSTGKLTVNGVQITYDVNTDTLNTILTKLNAISGIKAKIDAAGFFSITSQNGPLTLGAPSDSGNLLQVLKLDVAQINNAGGPPTTVTGVASVGGVNQTLTLNNHAANFVTPVTSGTFTINGVAINVDVTQDNLATVISRINASAAGVIASFDPSRDLLTLTNKATGPQSIVLGASGDTSNFLSATLLTSPSAFNTIGTQSSVTVKNPSGSTTTIFGSSNSVTGAIPGVSLNLLSNTTTAFTVTVAQDSSSLTSSLNGFVSAYNAAINEINSATSAPVISQTRSTASITSQSQQVATGGVLYGNTDLTNIRNSLIRIVSSFVSGNGTSYNSLPSIGLQLDSTFTTLTAVSSGGVGQAATSTTPGTPASTVTSTTQGGTSGQFQPLNLAKFAAALAANPSAVSNLLNGTNGIVTQLGTYLTSVTGLPTTLGSKLVGKIPQVSLFQNFENKTNQQITSLQSLIQHITDSVNLQADAMRKQFVASEALIGQYQSLQQQLGLLVTSLKTGR